MKMKVIFLLLAALMLTSACTRLPAEEEQVILLKDEGILLDGEAVSEDPADGVYTARDIVYYAAGQDITYGEGGEADAHSPEQAQAHTVLHIGQAGTYRISGTLSRGQIAVDLGEGAQEDPQAAVTLILDGADITCEVAPAVIFYRVYECASGQEGMAPNTEKAGANVIIADGTVNNVSGAYVARIYDPETVVLNGDGTEVEEAEKLHKYDGAFYSRMSMNIDGEKQGSGVLNICGTNEGLDSEMHLTLNGGTVSIRSGNDGINTNEDGVSVTTVNGGEVNITVTGETGEGDGIDSNGWLVINGGSVTAFACGSSQDGGIDADMGIYINGGTVSAAGHMLDAIAQTEQNYAVFRFADPLSPGEALTLKDEKGSVVKEEYFANSGSVWIYSSPDLKAGTYTLWRGDRQLQGMSGGFGGGERPSEGMGFEGGQPPEGEMPERPDGQQPPEGEMPERPEGQQPPEGEMPERPEGQQPPEGEMPEMPEGQQFPGGERPQMPQGESGTAAAEFVIRKGGNMFSGITYRQ